MKKRVLAIIGPTASGKTKLAVEVAKKINGEIISADSRQVYKNIPIATSHPSRNDLESVKHYFINELELEEEFNAGEFGKRGREVIDDIFLRGKQPIIAGGSGLYIRSLIDGLFENEIEDKEVRKTLYEKLRLHGEEFLYKELNNVDKQTAGEIPPRKVRRVIRALEVYYSTGTKLSELHQQKIKIDFETTQIGLLLDRNYLYQRINQRVDQMITSGLIEEVKIIEESGYDYKINYSVDSVGIKEVFKYLEGEYDYEEMVRLIKQNSRRYAKRQMTWFRKDKRIKWIEISDLCKIDNYVSEIIECIEKN